MWARLNLTKKIAALVIIGLLMVFLAFAFLSMQTLNQSTDTMLQERLTTASLVADYIDEVLLRSLNELEDTAFALGSNITDSERNLLIDSLNDRYSHMSMTTDNIFLVNKNGQVIWSKTGNLQAIDINMSASYPSIAYTINSGEPSISGTVSTPIAVTPVILLASSTQQGQLNPDEILVVAIDIAQSVVSGFIQPVKLGQTGYTEIVDQNGIVVARTEPGRPLAPFEKSDHPERFAALIRAGEPTVRTCHTCHEAEQQVERKDVLAFTPLKAASWGVVIRQSEDEALGPIRRLKTGVFAIGITSLVIALSITVLFVRRLLRPIQMLTYGAQKIAAGDLSIPIEARGRDEIGLLARTFETMRINLMASRQEIEDRSKDIEQRNLELYALNAIASTVSQSLDLDKSLGATLGEVLNIMKSNAGGIFIKEVEGQPFIMKAQRGFSDSLINFIMDWEKQLSSSEEIYQIDQPSNGTEGKDGIASLINVPLVSKGKLQGRLIMIRKGSRKIEEREKDLLTAIGHQISVAVDNSKLYKEVHIKEIQRGQLLERVMSVQEEERKRIARELHDDSAQNLTALIMHLESIERSLPEELVEIKQTLAKHRDLTLMALDDLRRVIADLRPVALDDLGLIPAIRWYAANHLEERGVKIIVKSSEAKLRLPMSLETALFRVAQEAINNISKHAECSTVKIQLELQSSIIRLVIEDNGRGFNVADQSIYHGKKSGLGLMGMRERVILFGGALDINSSPGHGTIITVEVPIGKEEEYEQNKRISS